MFEPQTQSISSSSSKIVKAQLPQNSAILVGGEKGGTGKSTVATNLAVMLKLFGYDVHLVDCDKQKTALKFAERRADNSILPNITCSHLSGKQLHITLTDLTFKYDVVVIDCGGQDSIELRAAMIAPCVYQMITPVQAGYYDLETLVHLEELVAKSQLYNPNLTVSCVINRATNHSQVTTTQEARAFISELDDIGLFKTILHDRVSYGYSAAKGESVVEHEARQIRIKRNRKGSHEICQLFEEITGLSFPVDSYQPNLQVA